MSRRIDPEHQIRWFVYVGDHPRTLIPREASMRGQWDYEARCSCGWETRTGGALRRWIQQKIEAHKLDVEIDRHLAAEAANKEGA